MNKNWITNDYNDGWFSMRMLYIVVLYVCYTYIIIDIYTKNILSWHLMCGFVG